MKIKKEKQIYTYVYKGSELMPRLTVCTARLLRSAGNHILSLDYDEDALRIEIPIDDIKQFVSVQEGD